MTTETYEIDAPEWVPDGYWYFKAIPAPVRPIREYTEEQRVFNEYINAIAGIDTKRIHAPCLKKQRVCRVEVHRDFDVISERNSYGVRTETVWELLILPSPYLRLVDRTPLRGNKIHFQGYHPNRPNKYEIMEAMLGDMAKAYQRR